MTRTPGMALSVGALILCLSHVTAVAQANQPHPCSLPEAQQFDFWVGEWELEWGEDGKGRNVIGKTLDGCVVTEDFDGTPSIPLRGNSVSTYNVRTVEWHQTWVDNQGGNLDFTGRYMDSRMVLQRRAVVEGKDVLQRMVWYEITDGSLRWNWERSDDGGETWIVLWEIRYARAAE